MNENTYSCDIDDPKSFENAIPHAWRHGLIPYRFITQSKYNVFYENQFHGVSRDYRIATNKHGIQQFLTVLQNPMVHTYQSDYLSEVAYDTPLPQIECDDTNLKFKPIFYHDLISNTGNSGLVH